MGIRSPVRIEDHPDRLLECEEALEGRVFEILDRVIANPNYNQLPDYESLFAEARAAGWREQEIVSALASLIDAHAMAEAENGRTDQAIKKASRLS